VLPYYGRWHGIGGTKMGGIKHLADAGDRLTAMAAADEAGLRYSLEVESAVADVKDAVGRAKHVEEKAYKSLLAVQTLMEAAIATRDVGLDGLPAVFADMLAGGSRGRTLVRL
jgi:hypothetical protein